MDFFLYEDAQEAGVQYLDWLLYSNRTLKIPWKLLLGKNESEIDPVCLQSMSKESYPPPFRAISGLYISVILLVYTWVPLLLMIRRRHIFPVSTRSIPLTVAFSIGSTMLNVLTGIRDYFTPLRYPCWLLFLGQHTYTALCVVPLSFMVLRVLRQNKLNQYMLGLPLFLSESSSHKARSCSISDNSSENDTFNDDEFYSSSKNKATSDSVSRINSRTRVEAATVLYSNQSTRSHTLSLMRKTRQLTLPIAEVKYLLLLLLPAGIDYTIVGIVNSDLMSCNGCAGSTWSLIVLLIYGTGGGWYILRCLRIVGKEIDSTGVIKAVKKSVTVLCIASVIWAIPGLVLLPIAPEIFNATWILVAGTTFAHWHLCIFPTAYSYGYMQRHVSKRRRKRKTRAKRNKVSIFPIFSSFRTKIEQLSSLSSSRTAQVVVSLTLDDVLNHSDGLLLFRRHLASEFNLENLSFWNEVRAWKKQYNKRSKSFVKSEAIRIYNTFIAMDAPFQVNIEGAQFKPLQGLFECQGQGAPVEQTDYVVPREVFDPAAGEIYSLMELDCFVRFKATPAYEAALELANM